MTLTDTGPIVALLDEDDDYHQSCLALAHTLPAGPLLTTWPCFTESMYLLGEIAGYRYQDRLWAMLRTGRLRILDITSVDADRMQSLMPRYPNVPMDVAGASLVAIAESRDIRRLFTIDSDFNIYVMVNGSVLEIIR